MHRARDPVVWPARHSFSTISSPGRATCLAPRSQPVMWGVDIPLPVKELSCHHTLPPRRGAGSTYLHHGWVDCRVFTLCLVIGPVSIALHWIVQSIELQFQLFIFIGWNDIVTVRFRARFMPLLSVTFHCYLLLYTFVGLWMLAARS